MADETTRRADEELRRTLDAGREIELMVTGRTSGREIANPVWFVQEGDMLYLVPVSGSDADWFKNVLKTPTVRLTAGAAQLSASVSPISDAAKVDQILDKFRREVWRSRCGGVLPEAGCRVEVPLTHPIGGDHGVE